MCSSTLPLFCELMRINITWSVLTMRYAHPEILMKVNLSDPCLMPSRSSTLYCSYLSILIERIIVVWSFINSLNSSRPSCRLSWFSAHFLSLFLQPFVLRHRTRSRYCRSCRETGPLRDVPVSQRIRKYCIIQQSKQAWSALFGL